MSETFDYRELDDDQKQLFRKVIGSRNFIEYDALMTYVTDKRIVCSALFYDETPFNPLEDWMTEIEIVTNHGWRNGLSTDDEGRFNRETGIVDLEDFPEWDYYDIDIWTLDGEDIEEMGDVKFPSIDVFGKDRGDGEVYYEDIDKYVARLADLRDSLLPAQEEAIANINEYIKDIENHKKHIAPNPHALIARFDGGYGYGYIDCVVIPSDSLIAEFTIVDGDIVEDGAAMLDEYLKGCLKTYASWAQGDVYGYVQNAYIDDEIEHVGSCWGFYGGDYATAELESIHKAEVDQQEAIQKNLDEIRDMFLP